jgi:DNA-binding NarL/FixJ family response regulator
VVTGSASVASDAPATSAAPIKGPPARRATDALIDIESRFANLTARQAEVYRAVARGLPNKLIARELGITESTVKTHLSAVYAVLGVNNRTQAAFQASREGFRVG